MKTDLAETKGEPQDLHRLRPLPVQRTDVYAMFMGDKITNQTSGTSFGVGIRHPFLKAAWDKGERLLVCSTAMCQGPVSGPFS